MRLDQRPVHGGGEQAIDVLVVRARIWPEQVQVLPAPDAWHQLDAEQVCKTENCRRLPVRVGVDRAGLQQRTVLGHEVEDGVAFVI